MSAEIAGLSGPNSFETPGDFAGELTVLRHRAGLSVRGLSQQTGLPLATLGGYFSGRHLPPLTQWSLFTTLLRGLNVEESDFDAWREALIRLRGSLRASRQPYRGLAPFRAEDADLFFGRASILTELHDAVQVAAHSSHRVVTIIGASGAGKSSLVLAGLLPELAPGTAVVVDPGADAVSTLREALASSPEVLVIDQFEEILRIPARSRRRREFVSLLSLASTDPGGPIVVVTLRADFLAEAMTDSILFRLLSAHQVLVGPMSDADLRDAIQEPARVAGAVIAPGLVDLVIRDVRNSLDDVSALPFLSHSLLETWRRSGGKSMTVAQYLETGGLSAAVEQSAEAVYDGLDADGRAQAQAFFVSLVTIGEGRSVARRAVPLADLDEVAELVEAFATVRIVLVEEDTVQIAHDALLHAWPRLSAWIDDGADALRKRRRLREAATTWADGGHADADLARGALLASIGELPNSTLNETERRFVVASSASAVAATARARSRRRRFRLLFAAVAVLALVASVLAVYSWSADVAANNAAKLALSRATALKAQSVAESDPGLAAHLALASYAIASTPEARAQVLAAANRATVTRLVGGPGQTHAVVSPSGLVFALAETDGSLQVWTRTSVGSAPIQVGSVMASKGNPQYAAAFSPDGRYVAIGGAGQTTLIDLTDPASPRVVASVSSGKSTVYGADFSSDGSRLVIATSAPATILYDIHPTAMKQVASAPGWGADEQAAAYSPDGRTIAVAAGDGAVHLVDAVTLHETGRVVIQATKRILSVAYDPTGRLLAASTAGGEAAVVGVKSGHLLKTFTGFPSWVNGVAFNATGTRLAAAASQGIVKAWTVGSWREVFSSTAGSNLTSPVFIDGGSSVLTSDVDGVARIYHLTSGSATLPDQIWNMTATTDGQWVYGVTMSRVGQFEVKGPDDMSLARTLTPPHGASMSGADGVAPDGHVLLGGARVGGFFQWLVGSDGRVGPPRMFPLGGSYIVGLVFSSDGRYAVASNGDGTTGVYSVGSHGVTLITKVNVSGSPNSATISPDGSMIAVGTLANTLALYTFDGRTLKLANTIKDFTNYVNAVSFSPTAAVLIGGSQDGTARAYDISDPTQPRQIGSAFGNATDGIFNAAISPDGDRYLAAATSAGGVVSTINGGGGQLYSTLAASGRDVTGAWAAGDYLFTGSSSGMAQQWFADADAARAFLCPVVGTPLTPSEWTQDVIGAKPRAYC